MAVSRTPKNADGSEKEPMFEQPFAQTFGPDPEPKEDERDVQLRTMAEQLAEMQRQLTEREEAPLPYAEPKVEGPALEQLLQVPDINTDLEGYINAKTQNAAIAVRNDAKKNQWQNTQSQDLDTKTQALYDQFEDAYPDLAGDPERIEFAALRVAKRARARGVDVGRYMFGTSARYLADVAKEYEKTFGKPTEEDDENDFEDEAPPARARGRKASASTSTRTRKRTRSSSDDDGRSAGVFGGNDSGGRPSGREDEEGPSMIDDIHKMQKETGFW